MMDFNDISPQMLPEEIVGNIINQFTDDKNPTSVDVPSESLMEDGADPAMNNGDNKVNEPAPATSSSKSNIVERKRRTNIQEFIRILRPNLPRKSKSRAYKLLKHIANGLIVEGTLQRRVPAKKTKKRPNRKVPVKTSKPKLRFATGIRRSVLSMCESSDSSVSEKCHNKFNSHHRRMKDSHCRCDYSCCKLSRY